MRDSEPRRPPSVLPRAWRVPLLLRVLVVLPLLCAAVAQGEAWWEEAALQTQDEFRAVKDTLEQTVARIDGAKEELERIEAFVVTSLRGPERDAVLAQLRGAQDALDAHGQPLRLASGRLGQVTAVVDGALEIAALADAARARQGGDLAAAMHVLGVAMERYGERLPAIGDMIAFYGAAIGDILNATDAIASSVETNRNQGMIGAGTHLGLTNPLYQALVRQFGADFADAGIFESAGYPYLYRAIDDDRRDFTLIWDPATASWERVERSPADMAELYRSYVLARGHPTPQVLRSLAGPSFGPARERQQAGEDAALLWAGLARGYDLAFDTVNRASDYDLLAAMQDPDLFAARFAHDEAFHLRVRAWMGDIYLAALRLGADDPTAQAIRAWAERYRIPLPTVVAAEGPAGDAGVEPTPQPDPAPDPATAAAVRDSVVILFDASGSMSSHDRIGMAKRAARDVLARLTPDTEVALIVFYDCRDIRVEQPFTTDVASVLAKVEAISPSGSTPLAASITLARGFLTDHARGAARLVVLSDGMETCGGDPVEAARP